MYIYVHVYIHNPSTQSISANPITHLKVLGMVKLPFLCPNHASEFTNVVAHFVLRKRKNQGTFVISHALCHCLVVISLGYTHWSHFHQGNMLGTTSYAYTQNFMLNFSRATLP